MSNRHGLKELLRLKKLADAVVKFPQTPKGVDSMIKCVTNRGYMQHCWENRGSDVKSRFVRVQIGGTSPAYAGLGQTIPEAIRAWASMIQDRHSRVFDEKTKWIDSKNYYPQMSTLRLFEQLDHAHREFNEAKCAGDADHIIGTLKYNRIIKIIQDRDRIWRKYRSEDERSKKVKR